VKDGRAKRVLHRNFWKKQYPWTRTVGAIDAQAGSTVSPRPGVGNLTANGAYHQAANALYQVDLSPAGGNDALVIHAAATLDEGGTLNVNRLDPAPYTYGHRYTVLTADQGLTGVFNVTGDTHISLFLDLLGVYDANNAYLQVSQTHSFDSVALTRNQRASAQGSDSLKSGPLFNAIANLQVAADARRAFDATSGEIYASARGVLLEESRFLRDAVVQRLDEVESGVAAAAPALLSYAESPKDFPSIKAAPLAPQPNAVWGHAFGSWGSTNGDGNAARLNRQTGGLFLGIDTPVDQWRVGLLCGYSHLSFDVHDRASAGGSDNFHLGVYGGTRWNGFGVKLGAAYSWHDLDVSRTAAFPTFSDRLRGKLNAGTAQVYGDFSYRYAFGATLIEPFLNVAYVNLHGDAFTERGGAAALTGWAGDTDLTYGVLGLRGSQQFALGAYVATLRASLGWKHAFGDVTPLQTLSFSGGAGFTVAGVPVARDAAAIKAGFDVGLTEALLFSIRYDGQIAESSRDHSVKGSLTYKF
jgi:outer membrane autotransporter protein